MNKTIKLLKKNYRWSEIIRDIKQYVRNCHICKRFKTARNKYHELLNLLSILDQSWINIILDFVTNLFDNKDYNAILMIVNKLSKIHHYIFCNRWKRNHDRKNRQIACSTCMTIARIIHNDNFERRFSIHFFCVKHDM